MTGKGIWSISRIRPGVNGRGRGHPGVGGWGSSPYMNISSMFTPKCLAILKARSRDGTYLPFSMARMVCLVTPIFRARSSWVRSFIAR